MAELRDLITTIKNLNTTNNSEMIVVTRVDFIDKYIGHTAIKTANLLQKNTGKVLFIDEAYSLFHGVHDDFGKEALITLCDYIRNHSSICPIIIMNQQDKDRLIKTLSSE